MPPLSVVIGLDVFEHISLRVFPRGITGSLSLFDLQGVKEAFHRRVVVAVPLAAHAAKEAVLGQQLLVVVRGLLATPIRVDDQPCLWPTSSHGHSQSLYHQVTGDSLRHRPADHCTGVQVQDDGQVQPARTRP